MKICMLVKNSFEFDARVTKEARSLIRAGHDVTVVALHVPGVTARSEVRGDGVRVLRVARIYGRIRDLMPAFLRASTTTPGASTTTPGASTTTPGGARTIPAAATAALPARRTDGRLGGVHRVWRSLLRRAVRIAAWPLQRVNDIVVGRRMLAAAVACAPHVVHAHDLNTLAVGARTARRTGARLIYDAHELHTARNDATPMSRWLARVREGRGVHRADAVITATDTWADTMARSYQVARPAVVRNMPPRTSITGRVDLRARLHLPADTTLLLYQGSIQTNRGIEQTIEALHHVPGCALVVCGYGARRPFLEERVLAAGLADRVRFDGPIPNDELIAYSAGADIGMCLIIGSSESYRTSLPNKLFEYLMAGIPVVASDFPEMGAIVRDTDAGEVCDPDNPRAVAAAIERLRTPARYDVARRNAERAATRLHWGSEEQILLSLYDRLGAGS